MTKVSAIVERKGAHVATVAPGATLADAATLLTEHGIGALVVSEDGRSIDGVLSERDIVRRLASSGPATLELQVADVMTTAVTTCTLESTTDELMVIMTDRRIRHLPVVDDGVLVGIVSIGDVVRVRMEELTLEADQLQAYVTGSY